MTTTLNILHQLGKLTANRKFTQLENLRQIKKLTANKKTHGE